MPASLEVSAMPAVLTPPAAPVTVSPAEYVRNLSPADQERALVALLTLAPRVGGELVPVRIGGHLLGHFVPVPKSDPEQLKAILANISAEDEEQMRHALATPGNSVTLDEFLAEMRAEAVAEAGGR